MAISDPTKKPTPMRKIGARPFGEILLDLAGGDVERQLTRDLAEVVRAVNATKKNGEITLKLRVSLDGKATLRVIPEITAKAPKEDLESQMFFSDESGGLHVENPRQAKMPFDPSEPPPRPRAVIVDDENPYNYPEED